MKNPAPRFEAHPNHSVKISSFDGDLRVMIKETVIGTTNSGLVLEESNYPSVYYLPIETLESGHMLPSDHTTYCPFKGTAEYFHLMHNGETTENAIWIYRDPYDDALAIKNYISIYPSVAMITEVE